jgi:glucokinase
MNPPLPYRIDLPSAPSRSTRVREANVRDLLRLLRRHAPCSRADLARLSGLTAPTVSAGINSLQRRDLVTALGNTSSNVGRPAGLLEFNARHGYVVGVDIGRADHVRIALADLNGTVIGRWSSALRAERSPEVVTELIAAGISRVSQQQKVSVKKILQIAVGAPGITDVAAGRVLSNLTGWHDVPLRDLLQRKIQIATIVENDVNLGALGEGWRGAARNVANFIFLAIGTGVGAGIVLNGMLHHGANWSAGEVGYLLLPGLSPDAPNADQPGTLESAIGGRNIEEAWIEQTNTSDSVAALPATDIFDLAANGDSRAREVLYAVADQLAMAITNLSLVLDLSLVVLSGGVGGHPGLLRAIERRLERNPFARPQLVIGSLNSEAPSYGAIWLALQACEAQGFRSHTLKSEPDWTDSLVVVP